MLNRRHIPLLMNAQSQARRDGWYRITNQQDEADVFIYGVIGSSFFDEGVEALQFVRELRDITAPKINLRINSPGGSVFDALAIRNALREHPATIETHIDGVAASAASWIGINGRDQRVVMAPKSRVFIHDPMSIMIGNASEFRQQADELDSIGDDIADMLAEKAGGSRQEWRNRMLAETWFTDRQAVDTGLADEIAGQPQTQNTFDTSILSIFKNTPSDLLQARTGNGERPSVRDAEAALREAGFSRNEAKAVLSRGWGAVEDEPRDVAAGLTALLNSIKAATT